MKAYQLALRLLRHPNRPVVIGTISDDPDDSYVQHAPLASPEAHAGSTADKLPKCWFIDAPWDPPWC